MKADVVTATGESDAATVVRTDQHAVHITSRENLTQAVSAITRAIESVRTSKDNVEGGTALIATLVDNAMKYSTQPGTAPAYEYHANGILTTLTELLMTFKAELAKSDEDEASVAHDFNMAEGARSMQVKFMNEEIMQKETLGAKKSEEESEKQKYLDEETADHDADQAYLNELTSSCEAKATLYDQRSTTRASELTALSGAIEELGGVGALYTANKKLVGLITDKQHAQEVKSVHTAQKQHKQNKHHSQHKHGRKVSLRRHHPRALLQTRSVTRGSKKIESLQKDMTQKAQELGSPALMQLVQALSAQRVADDHFVQVRQLIKDLIAKLEQDSIDEATSKGLCDTQMNEAVTARDEKQAMVESTSQHITATEASIASLKADIATLSQDIAELHKAVEEATILREAESAANTKTVADATAGSAATKQAITILKEFYGESFAQKDLPTKDAPTSGPVVDREGLTVGDKAPDATFDSEYSGAIGASKGIFGLLEVIASDFDRSVTATEAAETEAATDFETQTGLMTTQITDKGTLKETKEGEQTTAEDDLVTMKDDLISAKTMHEEALATLQSLTAACVDSGETWEERKANREKEIEALKSALNILEEMS